MRRFGIEIEFGGDMYRAAAALRDAGLGSGNVVPYSHTVQGQWAIKPDGSVRDGGEMVSPILDIDNPDDRAQVTRAVEALKSVGCTTNPTAGIHVHIDGSGMEPEQVAAVARFFTKFEDCIYRIASSGWESMRREAAHYCKPLSDAQINALSKAKTMEQIGRGYYQDQSGNLAYRQRSHGDHARYYGLNLHSWFYRKTIEFRVFNSSLNPERIQGYIGMCMAIVQDARNGFKRSVNKRYPLGGMVAGTTNEANARHRFLQVLRYDAGMALEDMERLTKIWKDSRPQTRTSLGLSERVGAGMIEPF